MGPGVLRGQDKHLPRYRWWRRVGQGGQGAVYRGIRRERGREIGSYILELECQVVGAGQYRENHPHNIYIYIY